MQVTILYSAVSIAQSCVKLSSTTFIYIYNEIIHRFNLLSTTRITVCFCNSQLQCMSFLVFLFLVRLVVASVAVVSFLSLMSVAFLLVAVFFWFSAISGHDIERPILTDRFHTLTTLYTPEENNNNNASKLFQSSQ